MKIRPLSLLILLFFGAVAARGAAAAQIRVELKPAAVLSAGEIQIGKVATVHATEPDLAQQIASTTLGATPWPGNARHVTREHVVMRLNRAGIDTSRIRWQGTETCTVTVRTAKITGAQIVKAARDYLTSLPLLQGDNVKIRVERTPSDKLVAVGKEMPSLEAGAASADRPWGRIRVYVKVTLGDRVIATIPVMFHVTCRQKVVVAARSIKRGEMLGPSHLDIQEIVLGPLSGTELYITKPEEIIGKEATRSLVPKTPLRTSMVKERFATRRGESVSVHLRSSHIEIVTKGVAQRDAYLGDTISVKVVTSGKPISCKVIGPNTVEISL